MMRVLLVNDEFSISGSSTALFRLARHLQGSGNAVSVFPRNPSHGPMVERYATAGIPIVHHAVATEFDAVIGNTILAAPVLLELAGHVPTIWFINEAEVALDLLRQYPDWARVFALVSAIIVNTPFQQEVLRSYTYMLDPDRVLVLPFGVDVDVASLPTGVVPPKRRALRVVQVGTFEPRKRPGDLVAAASQSGLDLECVLCGSDFGLLPKLHEAAALDPEGVRLLSGLPDAEVLAWVASADMFCLASGSETQALAAYEAALLGRPLLLTDLRCYHGVFRHGHECLLFPPGHVGLLSGLLRLLAEAPELRLSLGSAARRSAARFSNRRFFARFDTVLQDVVGR